MTINKPYVNIRYSLASMHTRMDNEIKNWLDHEALKSAVRTFQNLPDLHQPFFIIITPGSLHIVEICLSYIPPEIDIVLLLNGVEEWEQDWIIKHFKAKSIISVRTYDNRIIQHGKIFDLIFDNFPGPFGILDYDCFVFNPEYFNTIKSLASTSMLNAFFLRTQGVIEIPGTYFLYFNTPIINSIRQKYHVGSKIVTNSQLNKRIKEQLATIGFVENIYPQKGMDQFDTLILLIALGISEGLSCNYCMRVPGSPSLDSDRYEIFHVSGTTIRSTAHLQTPSFERWRLRGSFFWYRLLEAHNDDELKRQYQKKYGDIKAGELLDKVPGSREKLGNEFFTTVDRILRQYYKIQK